eukprot:TRINITY_DN10478_c0_g1_i1.p1 TRINITY_DN10478_c0_g1~~TRINITY_DN10478_c0_g1_i1.p1  ORF type:complete len:476 (+),score=123.60 TRINITY_DN10478_c0_g1_i1:35-1462(+)
MWKTTFLLSLACLLTIANAGLDKVDGRLLNLLSKSEEVSFLVSLPNAPLNSQVVEPESRPRYVFEALTRWQQQTQAPVIARLKELQVPFKSYWITNTIVVKGNVTLLAKLAQMEEVSKIEPNVEFKAKLEQPEEVFESRPDADTIEWNVEYVKAPSVWTRYQGEGFVVANADTGVQWNHPALLQQYRGLSQTSVDHNYNWWDAVHDGGSNRCGINVQEPCDDSGHGTHTTGTAVGFDHQGYYIGVAPAAKWIACRNMNAGLGTPQRYIECLQFFVAPTDLAGKNPKPELAPHVIGNSYGCPPEEGCSVSSLQTAVNNVIAAGIFMSVSAGNEGSGCSTVSAPPAVYENVCTVGATGFKTNAIASYSSRGPVTVDGSNRLKPNIVAPGSQVRSCVPTNQYAVYSGTSMASPAVTGSIPLVWSARPELLRDPAKTTEWLEQHTRYIHSTLCTFGNNGDPNNVYGYGELDLEKACSAN